jgi:hypothetical protein
VKSEMELEEERPTDSEGLTRSRFIICEAKLQNDCHSCFESQV